MADLSSLRARFIERAEAIHREAVETILSATREAAPSKDGTLRASIVERSHTVEASRVASVIGTDIPYAVYQDTGTGIYGPRGSRIYPVNARALRFEIDGVVIFAASVAGAPRTGFWSDNVTQQGWTDAVTSALR